MYVERESERAYKKRGVYSINIFFNTPLCSQLDDILPSTAVRTDTTTKVTVDYLGHILPVYMTTEIDFIKPTPPRPYAPRSHMHTGPLILTTTPSLWLNR